MINQALSITDWRELTHQDPELAANTLHSRLEGIAPAERRSLFPALPSREELIDSFIESSSSTAQLAGVPFFLKDLFDIPGYQTTASSAFLAQLRPSPKNESALSQSIRSKGGVFAGKTHLNEFAYGLSGENLTYGNCPHPIFPEKLSGGSSSASAWAVRRGVVPIATGTDTAGSIRVPAAWCGVYGLRLAPNDWSTQGCFPLAPSFDTAGWFCSTGADMDTTIRALLEPLETTSGSLQGLSLLDSIKGISKEHRTHYLDTLNCLGVENDVQANEAYHIATQSAAFHYSVLGSLEALEVHKTWLDPQKDQYDPVVYHRIERARHWTSTQIENARNCEIAIKGFFDNCFEHYDFIAIPATQSPAISASEHTNSFRSELLEITAPGSFARCPVLTIPIHIENNLTLGMQILYKENHSDLPLRVLEKLGIS